MEVIHPNEKSGYIQEIVAKNFFSIENVNLSNLDKKREVYLLGENGDGKSLILMALVLAFKGGYIIKLTKLKETGEVMDIIKDDKNNDLNLQGTDNDGFRYFLRRDESDKFYGFKSEFKIYKEMKKKHANGKDLNEKHALKGQWGLRYMKNLLAYGVHRSRNDSEKPSEYGFMTLFDSDQYLISPESWLKALYTKELEKAAGKKSIGMSSISLKIAKEILSDLVDRNVNIDVDSSGVTYIERGTPMRFSQLSEGYKSVITWICDMVARLADKQPDVHKIQDLEGVVLVDEINLHLHPRWEKQIVKKLRHWFPKVQFFLTTHSPVTILGASDDAVFYRVYKEEGITKVSEPYFKENLKDLMANSVLTSPLFGLEDARMESKQMSDPDLDTSEDFLHSRIHQKITARLEQKKKDGKVYFSKEEIDAMIDEALDEELA